MTSTPRCLFLRPVCLLCLALAALSARALPAQPLQLTFAGEVDGWQAITILSDPDGMASCCNRR